MEISISEVEERSLGLTAEKRSRIVSLIHAHIGCASVVEVDTTQHPCDVTLATASGTILVDREFTRRTDMQ
mgnify:CR=1 FL=1